MRRFIRTNGALLTGLAAFPLAAALASEGTSGEQLLSLDTLMEEGSLAQSVKTIVESQAQNAEEQHALHRHSGEKTDPVSTESLLISVSDSGKLEFGHIPYQGGNPVWLSPAAADKIRSATGLGDLPFGQSLTGVQAIQRYHAGMDRTIEPDLVETTDGRSVFGARAIARINDSPIYQKCKSAQAHFAANVEDRIYTSGYEPLQEARINKGVFASAAREFDKQCLDPVDANKGFSRDLPLKYIGVLQNAKGEAFCMAGYLGQGNFVTARHCMEASMTPQLSFANDPGKRWPASFVLESYSVGPGQEPCVPDAKTAKGACDVVRLKVGGLSLDPKPEGLTAQTPDTSKPARIVGYFAFADPTTTFASGNYPVWTQALRTTKEDVVSYCRVIDISRSTNGDGIGCLQHSCQAVPGFSGAPIFMKTDSGWALVGIHTSGNGPDLKCPTPFKGRQGAGLFENVGNAGTLIPTALTRFLK